METLDTLPALRALAQEVMDLQTNPLGLGSNIQELQQQGMLLLLQLKDDSRTQAFEAERQKEETSKSKKQLEEAHLSLQNLIYERQYYEKEIQANLSYRPQHSDETVGLIPEKQFLAEASEAVLARIAAGDQHTLMLERLQHELQTRKLLAASLEGSKQQKAAAQASTAARQKVLDDLKAQLQTLEGHAAPLQIILAPQLSSRSVSRIAHLLPLPLFILFSQLTACKDALSLPIRVQITGSVVEAESAATSVVASAAESGQTAGSAKGGKSNKGRKVQVPRSNGQPTGPVSMQIDNTDGIRDSQRLSEAPSPPPEDLYKPHPLIVIMELLQQSTSGPAGLRTLMAIKFQWLPLLKVLTAHSDVAADNMLLEKLVPGDVGDGLTFESLAQMECGSFVYSSSKAFKPYRWCQMLGGLDFVPPLPLCTLITDSEQSSVVQGLTAFRKDLRVSRFVKMLTEAKGAQ